jgi:hypothetical protein
MRAALHQHQQRLVRQLLQRLVVLVLLLWSSFPSIDATLTPSWSPIYKLGRQGTAPFSIASGDITGDGLAEIVLRSTTTLQWFRNAPTGSTDLDLIGMETLPVATNPVRTIVTDVGKCYHYICIHRLYMCGFKGRIRSFIRCCF